MYNLHKDIESFITEGDRQSIQVVDIELFVCGVTFSHVLQMVNALSKPPHASSGNKG